MQTQKNDLLLTAIRNDDPAEARRLINEGADPCGANRVGMSLLRYACEKSRLNALRVLLEAGASADKPFLYVVPSNPLQNRMALPLQCAGSPEVVAMLVSFGADINGRDPDGVTALAYAIHHRRSDVVRYLVEHGADMSTGRIVSGGREVFNAIDYARNEFEEMNRWRPSGKVAASEHLDAILKQDDDELMRIVEFLGVSISVPPPQNNA